MLAPLALALLGQLAPPLNVFVLDVSAPDAVYEDISREQALDVVDAFNAAGFIARRIDESELPKGGCRGGPCLQKVALDHKADVLVTVDAVELEGEKKTGVASTALEGRTGRPLGGGRWTITAKTKRPTKELTAFVRQVAKSAKPPPPPPDGGSENQRR